MTGSKECERQKFQTDPLPERAQAFWADYKRRDEEMALTRSFASIVDARIAREPEFRDALLRESVETMLTGDVEAGKAVLRRYIEATIGFDSLGESVGTPSQKLIRMFEPNSDPNAGVLFSVLDHLQKLAGVRFHLVV